MANSNPTSSNLPQDQRVFDCWSQVVVIELLVAFLTCLLRHLRLCR